MVTNYIVTTETTAYLPDDSYKSVSPDHFFKEALSGGLSSDIIGIYMGNARLTRYDYPLSGVYINEVMKEYDMILPFASNVREQTVGEALTNAGVCITEYISSFPKIFMKSYERIAASRLISSSDSMVLSGSILPSLLRFIYGCPSSNVPLVRDVLLRVFITAHTPSLRIKEENIKVSTSDTFRNFLLKTQNTYNYFRNEADDYINFRKKEGFGKVLIPEMTCNDSFDGKIPVWVCWWQGLDDMPEIIKGCLKSIERNIPSDITELRLITLENYKDYVTLTDDIIRKFEEKKISYTHLSEVLRSELLYRYGGLWIDASYYVSKPVPRNLFKRDFYTIAFDRPLFGPDISGGKWSTSLWYVSPHSTFMQFLTELKMNYWEKNDDVYDYFVFDYDVAIAFNEFKEWADMIEACPKSSEKVYELQLRLNQNYTPMEEKKLQEDSVFYKINRRGDFKAVSDIGDMTVYGAIVSNTHSTEVHQTYITFDSVEEFQNEGLGIIRAKNPSSILDASAMLSGMGAVSRMWISEVLKHPVQIDAVADNTSILPIDYGIYDNIYSECPDESAYELVLRSAT